MCLFTSFSFNIRSPTGGFIGHLGYCSEKATASIPQPRQGYRKSAQINKCLWETDPGCFSVKYMNFKCSEAVFVLKSFAWTLVAKWTSTLLTDTNRYTHITTCAHHVLYFFLFLLFHKHTWSTCSQCAILNITVTSQFGSWSFSVVIHLFLSVFISNQVCCAMLIPTGNLTCIMFSEHLPDA